jgi:hypothetical protein
MHVDPTPQDAPRPDVDAPTLHAAYAPPLYRKTEPVTPEWAAFAAELTEVPAENVTVETDRNGDAWIRVTLPAPSPTTDEGDE